MSTGCIVENVFPLDLEALSERVGVTQEEIVGGLVQMNPLTKCLQNDKQDQSAQEVEAPPPVKEVFLLVSSPKKKVIDQQDEELISSLANIPGQAGHQKALEYLLEILFSTLSQLQRILISLPYQHHYLESMIESFPCVQAAVLVHKKKTKCHVDFLLLPSELEKQETNTLDAILLAQDAMFEPGFLLIDFDHVFEKESIENILEQSDFILEKHEKKKKKNTSLFDFFMNNSTIPTSMSKAKEIERRPRLTSDTTMSEIDLEENKSQKKAAKKMIVALTTTSGSHSDPIQQGTENQELTGLYLCSVDVFRQFDFLRMTQKGKKNQIKCLQDAMVHLTKYLPELIETVQLPLLSTAKASYHFLKQDKNNNQHDAFVSSYQNSTSLQSKSFFSRVMIPLKNTTMIDNNNLLETSDDEEEEEEKEGEEEQVPVHEFAIPEEQPEDLENQWRSSISTKNIMKKRTSFNSSSLQVLSPIAIEATVSCPSDKEPYIIQVDKSPLKPHKSSFSQQEFLLALPALTSATTINKSIHRLDLPSAVHRVTMEATEADTTTGRVSLQLVVQQQVPLIGYMVLFTALFAVSSQGAALDMLTGVSPLLKLFWRMVGASLTFCPFAVWKCLTSSNTRQDWFNIWHQIKWKYCFCGLCYTIFNATFLLALNMTSIGHVYIFSNCHSLLMVIGKIFFGPSGSQLHYLEISGALIGFIGGTITTLDHKTTSNSHTTTTGVIEASTSGDLVAFVGAFAGCFYLFYAKELRGKLGVWLFLFGIVTVVWVTLLPILFLTLPALEVSTDPYNGLFGWFYHLNIEAYIVLVGSFCGTMGFVASMKYFDPLVVSVTMLMEPMVAIMIGICLGIEAVPGIATFLGGFGVLVGCFLVLIASRTSTKSLEISNKITHTSMKSHKVTTTVTPEKQNLLSFASQRTTSSSTSDKKTYGSFM